jgi:hypothetical protein
VDRVGPVRIHRLLLAKMESDHRRILGGHTVYVAIRDDAVFVAMGSGALGAIKDALAVAPSSVGLVMDLQITASKLVPSIKEPAAQEMARKVFADKKDGNDRFLLTSEGGDASTLRLTAGAKFIEYAALLMFMPSKPEFIPGGCATGPDGACIKPVPVLPTEK